MAREFSCYVFGSDPSAKFVDEYIVRLTPKAGYTPPTIGDMDSAQTGLDGKLHKSLRALERLAHGTAFDLDVDIVECPLGVPRDELAAELQEQADEIEAASVRGLRR